MMKKTITIVISSFVSALLSIKCQAFEFNGISQNYSKVRGWTVGWSKEKGHCIAAAKYHDGTTVFFGLNEDTNLGFLAFFNPGWQDIQAGSSYRLRYNFGRSRWNGPVKGSNSRWGWGYRADNLKVKFIIDIADARFIRIWRGSWRLVSLNLSGTQRALDEVIDCQRAQARARLQKSLPRKIPNRKPSLGVEFNLSNDQAMITLVKPNTAASRAGLEPGDIITGFAGTNITSKQQLLNLIHKQQAGVKALVEYTRNGQKKSIAIALDSEETSGNQGTAPNLDQRKLNKTEYPI